MKPSDVSPDPFFKKGRAVPPSTGSDIVALARAPERRGKERQAEAIWRANKSIELAVFNERLASYKVIVSRGKN